MFRRSRFVPSPSMLLAFAALVVACSGTAVAASLITSKQIKDGTIQTKDISKKALKTLKGKAGPAGAPGSAGQPGPKGDPGPATGPAGGALAGNYPNPSLAAGAVTPGSMSGVPTVRVFNSATANIATSTSPAPLSFDTESYDTANMHNAANPTRLTAPIAGIYAISGSVHWNTAANGYRQVGIYPNGTSNRFESELTPVGSAADYVYMQSTTQALLHAGDYVELDAAQTSGATVMVLNGDDSAFEMTWIAPAP